MTNVIKFCGWCNLSLIIILSTAYMLLPIHSTSQFCACGWYSLSLIVIKELYIYGIRYPFVYPSIYTILFPQATFGFVDDSE